MIFNILYFLVDAIFCLCNYKWGAVSCLQLVELSTLVFSRKTTKIKRIVKLEIQKTLKKIDDRKWKKEAP